MVKWTSKLSWIIFILTAFCLSLVWLHDTIASHPWPDLPYCKMALCQGPRALIEELFLVFRIRRQSAAKILEVQGAPRNVNSALLTSYYEHNLQCDCKYYLVYSPVDLSLKRRSDFVEFAFKPLLNAYTFFMRTRGSVLLKIYEQIGIIKTQLAQRICVIIGGLLVFSTLSLLICL